MSRQPQIVVVMHTNDLAVRLAQHMVTIKFANARRLWQVKEADTWVGSLQLGDHGAQLIAHAVAADQDFQVVNALGLHTAHGVGQRRAMLMRGNQNADAWHGTRWDPEGTKL